MSEQIDKEIKEKEKKLLKLRKTLEKVPFTYTSTFDEGEFTSLGKVNILDGKFNLEGFEQHDISENAQLLEEEIEIFFPDGTTDKFNLTALGIDFNDLDEKFKLITSDALEKNISHYRMLELNLNMDKKSAEKEINDIADDNQENTRTFRI